MKCNSCGSEISSDANVCPYCGKAVGTGGYNPVYSNPAGVGYNPGGYNFTPMPMSVGGWLWRPLLLLIPLVGWLIYFIMLFVWRSDQTKDLTFRNWATAQLVWIAILFALVLLSAFTIGAPLLAALLAEFN